MVKRGQAPAGAVAPQAIPDGSIWKLDVDDEVWQDVGLEDTVDGEPPMWLKDDNTRVGIRLHLDFDRCCEEEVRLIRERQAMQDWMFEEWNVISAACLLSCESEIDVFFATA